MMPTTSRAVAGPATAESALHPLQDLLRAVAEQGARLASHEVAQRMHEIDAGV